MIKNTRGLLFSLIALALASTAYAGGYQEGCLPKAPTQADGIQASFDADFSGGGFVNAQGQVVGMKVEKIGYAGGDVAVAMNLACGGKPCASGSVDAYAGEHVLAKGFAESTKSGVPAMVANAGFASGNAAVKMQAIRSR